MSSGKPLFIFVLILFTLIIWRNITCHLTGMCHCRPCIVAKSREASDDRSCIVGFDRFYYERCTLMSNDWRPVSFAGFSLKLSVKTRQISVSCVTVTIIGLPRFLIFLHLCSWGIPNPPEYVLQLRKPKRSFPTRLIILTTLVIEGSQVISLLMYR